MAKIKAVWILIFIVVLAAALRLWQLPSNPPGLTWDEASLGYNAYSILKTGRDEYGQLLPLNLKSFGDYKPAVYTYLDIPFVAAFGLNELAVRLPAVLFGVGLVVVAFLLIKELLAEETTLTLRRKEGIGLAGAFFLAISPLAIQFSRPAFEAGVALFFNTLAILFFIKGIKNSRFFLWSAALFGLSMFTYQGSRLFVPIMIVGLFLIYRKQVRWSRALKISAAVLALFALILGYLMVGPGQSNRLATMNFFAYQRSPEKVSQIASEDNLSQNSLSFQVLHGEWFAYTRGLFERYLIYFSPKMLFADGDYNQRDRVPDLGVLYYISVLFVPLGLISLLGFKGSGAKLVLFWLLLAPLPAVLSRDLITMLRGLNMVLPLTILEGLGLFWLLNYTRRIGKNVVILAFAALSILIFGSVIIYLDRYFVHAPREYSEYWLDGYKDAMLALGDLTGQKQYEKVVFTDTYGQPYIYYLFYNRYPPQDFQKQAILEQSTVDVGTVRKINNIEFRHVYWPVDRGLKNSLFIGSFEELPDKDVLGFPDYTVLKEIKFRDGLPAFRIVETK